MPTGSVYEFSTQQQPYEVHLSPGIFLFEAWGASGHSNMCSGFAEYEPKGRGAYTSGILKLKSPKTLYVYVGEKWRGYDYPTFNGNVYNFFSFGGGGATDFRLEKGTDWSTFESLKSRIMVAAGGGAGDCYSGGDAGALTGFPGEGNGLLPTGGTQTSFGKAGQIISDSRIGYDGEFGIGGSGACRNQQGACDGGGSGGGGYYGGGGTAPYGGGAGGSSFVSGFPGCGAIYKNSTKTAIYHSGQPIHYSTLSFSSPSIIPGNELMPSPHGTSNQIGNSQDGFAKITVLILFLTQNQRFHFQRIFFTLFLTLQLS